MEFAEDVTLVVDPTFLPVVKAIVDVSKVLVELLETTGDAEESADDFLVVVLVLEVVADVGSSGEIVEVLDAVVITDFVVPADVRSVLL